MVSVWCLQAYEVLQYTSISEIDIIIRKKIQILYLLLSCFCVEKSTFCDCHRVCDSPFSEENNTSVILYYMSRVHSHSQPFGA